jgi:hypothetical protein
MAIGIEEFKREIINKLAPKKQKTASRAFVFVNMESADKPLAEKVSEFLRNKGLTVFKSISSGTPEEIRKDLEDNLLGCDALIIVYGNTTRNWVRAQLRYQEKIIRLRVTPLKVLAVLEGPPEPKMELEVEMNNLNIINCIKGVDESELDRFLELI